MFQEKDLPKDKTLWDKIFLSAMGSPDPNERQMGTNLNFFHNLSIDSHYYKMVWVGVTHPFQRLWWFLRPIKKTLTWTTYSAKLILRQRLWYVWN